VSMPALERICAKVYLARVLPGCIGIPILLSVLPLKVTRCMG